MSSGKDSLISKHALGSSARNAISVRNFVMLVAGVLAGYSIAVLGKDAVVVPLVGSVHGTLFGVVGLALAVSVYRVGGCCGDCGDEACGCAGECEDSCSYNP